MQHNLNTISYHHHSPKPWRNIWSIEYAVQTGSRYCKHGVLCNQQHNILSLALVYVWHWLDNSSTVYRHHQPLSMDHLPMSGSCTWSIIKYLVHCHCVLCSTKTNYYNSYIQDILQSITQYLPFISKYGVFIRSKSDVMDTAVKSLMIGTTTLSDATNLTMIGTSSSSCSHHCLILQLLCFDTFISQRFRVGLSSIVDSNDTTIWLEYMWHVMTACSVAIEKAAVSQD